MRLVRPSGGLGAKWMCDERRWEHHRRKTNSISSDIQIKTTVSATILMTLYQGKILHCGHLHSLFHSVIKVNKGLLQPARSPVVCESTCACLCGNLSLSTKLFNHRSTFQLRSLLFPFLSARPARTNRPSERQRACAFVCEG